ncbi:type I-E CRISPR-associated protein Cas6/Cse3/CasE [Streptomyces sp. XH2]|uniref:type I-E CRISPR-associated protein Cas6/Cse3/CasE n=1 Tax=Streptomyces sp. XH2 TaxID=3412483 RepID=UPI003C7ACE65
MSCATEASSPVTTGAPTRRAAHITVRHQAGWLLKQQERCGFAVLRTPLSLHCRSRERHVLRRQERSRAGTTPPGCRGREAGPAQ